MVNIYIYIEGNLVPLDFVFFMVSVVYYYSNICNILSMPCCAVVRKTFYDRNEY